jgi:hypothetical protein
MALMIVGYSTTLYCCTYRLVFRIEVVRWVSYLITTDLTDSHDSSYGPANALAHVQVESERG